MIIQEETVHELAYQTSYLQVAESLKRIGQWKGGRARTERTHTHLEFACRPYFD